VNERSALLVLAASAGAVDAISFLTFDVFTANMTGNVVLLGIALNAHSGAQAIRAGVAVVGFAVGVLLTARFVGRAEAPGTYPPRTGMVLAGALALQAAFLIGWLSVDGTPTGGGRDLLIAVSAVAMGAQSAAVAAMRFPNVATTYVTGTLTGLLGSVATGNRAAIDLVRIGVIVALAVGATIGAVLVSEAHDVAPLLPAALTATVLAGAAWTVHKHR
jgi:uncharacterized membrane protein YoaK (UPF0700 family)